MGTKEANRQASQLMLKIADMEEPPTATIVRDRIEKAEGGRTGSEDAQMFLSPLPSYPNQVDIDRQMFMLGGLVSKLVRKLFTKHKGDAAVESDLSYLSSKIEDVDNEISSFTKQEVNNSSSIRESVNELERNKDDLVSGLKQIEEEGIPLNYDEEGFPITKKAEGENYPKDMFGNRLSNKDLDEIERMIAEGEMYPDEGESILKRAGRIPKAEGGEIDDQMNALAISVSPAKVEAREVEEPMLPDEEMEEDYVDYVVEETLATEDKMYLNAALEKDAKLSEIFDQVVESATEFTGSGTVEGPGTSRSDSIPARLSDGEFVFTTKATAEIGEDNLMSMMKEAEAAADQRQMAYEGGMIREEKEVMVAPQEPQQQNINVTKTTLDNQVGLLRQEEDLVGKAVKENMMLDPYQRHVRS